MYTSTQAYEVSLDHLLVLYFSFETRARNELFEARDALSEAQEPGDDEI